MSGASEVPAIPGRVVAPKDVTDLADKVFTRGRKFGQSYRDMIAEAIMADRAARPVDTGREKALEEDDHAVR